MGKVIMKWFNELLDSMTTGSIPERSQCDCKDMAGFCKKLHKIQMTGVCRREA